MPTNLTRPFRLKQAQKEVIDEFMHGELSETEAAKTLGMTRHRFSRMIANIARHMTMEGTIPFSRVFKEY